MGDNSFAGINFDDSESPKIFEYHRKNMCSEIRNEIDNNNSSFLSNLDIDKNVNNGGCLIKGSLKDDLYARSLVENIFIKYIAANPPTYNSNFSGSGLPYPNVDVAFENTPNKGIIKVENGKFNIIIKYPNSYYENMGSLYIPPQIKLVAVNKDNKNLSIVEVINLGEGIPFRTLTWPVQRDWNKGALFYKVDGLPVRTQNQILLDSAYPIVNKMPANFWGLTPPH
jgi:hypothetical protein